MAVYLSAEARLDAVERELEVIWDKKSLTTNQSLQVPVRVPVREAWNALTTQGRLAQWFSQVSGDLQSGGRYAVADNASGLIVECNAPLRYSLTWEFGGDTSDVVVEIAREQQGSRVRLLHVGEVPRGTWREFGPGATGVGWDLSLFGLVEHLEGGLQVPPEATQWMHTPEARAFITGSSRRWGDASIAAGTPAAEARAAADRTAAFYLGEGPGAG